MKEADITGLIEAARWLVDAVDQANTGEAIRRLGHRGKILLQEANDVRRILVALGQPPTLASPQ